MTLISCVDNIVMLVILLLTFEQVRRVRFFDQPLAAVVFILLCVGSFGKVAHSVTGGAPPWWAIALHAGFGLLLLRSIGANPSHWKYIHGLVAARQSRKPPARLVPQTQGRQRPHPSD